MASVRVCVAYFLLLLLGSFGHGVGLYGVVVHEGGEKGGDLGSLL